MYIDFIFNDTSFTDAEVKTMAHQILDLKIINSITCAYHAIKPIKAVLQDAEVGISCLIDYPLGISDLKTRQTAIQQAADIGCNYIDIVMPQIITSNRKYDKVREDVKTISELCITQQITPRYILEYRTFDQHCLKKMCEIFDGFNINFCFPSTNYFIDNLSDNILASVFLYQNSKNVHIIATGNAWTSTHFEILLKSGLFGFRTNQLESLKNFKKFDSATKTK